MADQQLTQLTAVTTFSDTDLLYTVVNVPTTPASRKITWTDFQTNIGTKLGTIINAVTGKTVPVDADNFIIGDSAASNASKKLTWANIKTALNLLYAPLDGWIADSNIWTYSSADSPTFVASVNADVTGIINVGKRIKLTQTTVKYFIVTAVGAYSGGATLITLYGGTDYTLANASITSPYYSSAKVPFGFPADPAKWTVSISDTADRTQASPTGGTWYNQGTTSAQISIPIGAWIVTYSAVQGVSIATTQCDIALTLSTASNTESDSTLTSYAVGWSNANSAAGGFSAWLSKRFNLNVASKTTYYLNSRTNTASTNNLRRLGSTGTPTLISALCAYL